MSGPYEDIIEMPHHVSKKHPQMSAINRAAQFAPFAALTGHDAAIKETARLTDRRLVLDEDALGMLDAKQGMLKDMVEMHPEIVVTYFRPDEKKAGGAYVSAAGAVKKIDGYDNSIVLMNGETIPAGDILDIECELFPSAPDA